MGRKDIVSLDASVSYPAPANRVVSLERLAHVPVTELLPGAAFIDPSIDNPYAGNPDALAAGRRHYSAFNCAGCHAPLGGGGMGPSLSDDSWIYGSDPAQIYLSIMHGRPEGMPAFSSMLTDQIVWELAAYVRSLSSIDDYADRAGFSENVSGYRAGGERNE
ncbi:MAG: c-type cytochrome [Alphaproteobacteria bacterium]|nr:c-type cytochrome [Alphaproteobacteria bacterium]